MTVSVRLNDNDAMLFRKYAEMHGISMSELVRRSVLERIEDDFDMKCYEKAMQDGIQLDTALVYPDPDSFVSITDDKFTGVAPGNTFEVHTAFVLRDETSPIEVKFSDLFEKKGISLDEPKWG